MAKRSDFAQKLLDDLRLRKERLASSSQSSNRSNSSTPITDPYSYARQNYRGSKDCRTNDTIGSRNGVGRNSGSNGIGRLSSHSEHHNHIVPYNNGRSQASHQISDLSTALAFALENAGKISRTDSSPRSSMFELLQRIGTKSMEPGKNKTTTVRGPEFSPIQIEEISKGVQRMNRILRGNLDKKESIKIGKELLKGAIDLENSLKMRIAEPLRKNRNRIEIIDDDDQDDSKVAEEWNLDRRRFPFDEKETGRRTSLNRIPMSQDSQQKARIPNVIAKLMGLENLPEGGGSWSRRKIVEDVKKNDFLVNTSFAVVRERNSFVSHVRIEEDIRSKKTVKMKKDKHQEIVEKNLEASSQFLPQKRQPDKQSSRNQMKKSHSNDRMEMKTAVLLKVDEIRNQSLKHKANAMNSPKSGPEKTLSKKTTSYEHKLVKERSNSAELNIVKRTRARLPDEKAVRAEKSRATKEQNKRKGSVLNSMTRSTRKVKPIREEEAHVQDQLLITKAEETCHQITSLPLSDGICQIKIVDDQLYEEAYCDVNVPDEVDDIFTKSQVFLNTAEALFSLDIPIMSLHESTIDEQRNLMLDCGYELMRRKGRRYELSLHPNYHAILTAPITTFEGLVTEISRDFKSLRLYGKDEYNLAGMLESDVYGREADVNCMWDSGWNDLVFAFAEVDEVVREFDKFLLNHLLDEIVVDMFSSYAIMKWE